ncbi:MAG TPA: amino acid adenylation domain-containing protein, partial [Thermoanaerobaculia bacterium]|nr:amino acid adenylation domain-containing protein [Thermoanaerobaculia bacterium]
IAELVRLGPPPAGLRIVNLAGEPLKRALVQQIERWHPGVRVLNLYGPSEDTTYSTWAEVSGEEGTVTIGRPVAGTAAYLLDPHGNPVPRGVPGELHLAGAGHARGYFGQPELTAAKFIPDPFAPQPGGRLYATGDLARLRQDGNLEFLGRIDHQVKIRGFRIEPGEIEAVLAAHPGVEAVAVVPQEMGSDDRRLVAYVVGQTLDLEELRAIAACRLPGHMVPSAFLALPALPLTANGKLDRRALPRPDLPPAPGAAARPRNPTEELLVGLWAELLGLDAGQVGIDSNLFALGGHSLLATRLISRVRKDLRVEVPLRGVFEAQTPAGLARLILASREVPEAPPIQPVPRTGSMRRLPLSFAQERLWFLDQLDPRSATYNIPAAVRLRGRLDTRSMAACLQEIVRRHEALRTTFAVDEGRPVQRIAPPGPVALPVIDLEGQSKVAEVAQSLSIEESRRGFDLERGPLWRATLLRLSEGEHLLLLILHHTVTDGWSMGVFARELSAIYEAFAGGLLSPLPELPIQYADFARWQREWMSGAVLEGQLAYWRRQLEGAPVLELPSDRPPPRVRASRGASQSLELSRPLAVRLEELARREGVTLFMVLLGGFAALLSRYTEQEDVSIGTAIANRNRAETEGLIGFFANMLVLRADLSGDPSGRGLLARVRELALSAYAYQDLPFERLVQELQPQRDAETLPLFRVVLTLGADPALGLALPGLTAEPWPLDTGSAKFDLTLQISASDRGLAGVLEYSSELFDTPTPQRLVRHFASLLEDLAADPERRVSGLALLTTAERHHLLAEWSGASGRPLASTIPELFARQVELRPDAVAVSLGEQRLTYGELDQCANRLAHHLGRLGVGPEVPVGLYLERSLDLIVALVAIVKSGGAYVPLDPSHPRERMAFILAQTGSPIILTWERLRGDLPEPARVLCLDGDDRAKIGDIAEPPAPTVSPGNLAYVLYTSGSTGEPKGVGVPHRAVVRLVRDTGYASFSPDEVFLQLAPVPFDASTLEIWGPLLNGGRLALAPAGPVALEELEQVIARERVTTLWLTAGLFHQMVDQAGLRGLRQLLAGGDVLSPQHVRRALEQLPGCTLINGYGPTENTTFSCCHRMSRPEDVGTPVPIGPPIARTTAYVVDRAGQPCPAGVPGELWAGGDGLARGYVGRPDLTAERFVPHPFGGPGERLYRTGDRVRFLPDGSLEFLGRVDQQVKIRGFRIEPGEIEAVLAAHPSVKAVAVLPQEVGPDDRRLVAYVVGRVDSNELRALATERLPRYMVPSAFVELPALPLTPNGKVDWRALPREDWTRVGATSATGTVARPRNPTEELLVGLWEELLGLEAGQVGIDASFFDLGGHSLLATRLISRVREDLRVEVPLHGLFDDPTPAGLARLVLAAREGPEALPIRTVPRKERLPLSFAQERLWFLDQLEPGSATYNIPAVVRLKGRLDIHGLTASLQEIVRRHEALRTTFTADEGRPVQRIVPPAPVALPVIDLEGWPEVAQSLSSEESRRSFDLERGPLWRATLLRLGEEEHLLLLTLHHIVSDGWSMGVFVRELSALYAGVPLLPELPVQYVDVAVWQRERLDSGALAAQSAYWKSQLGDLSVLQLPTDRPHKPGRSSRGASLEFQLSAEIRAGLQALAQRERVTLFMLLLGSFQVLLSRYADQEDVAIGTAIANRNRFETEDLIGLFVNTLVLRTDLSGDPDRRELLRRVRKVTLDAYAHQDLPFEKLVEELAPERDLSRSPLIGVLLILQNMPLPELSLPGIAAESLPVPSHTARLDLTLSLFPQGEGLGGWLEFATDLFDEATVSRMAGHLELLLEGLAGPAEEPRLSTLPLLTPAERAQLLAGWNDVELTECLHEAFAAQASANPEAVAVVCGCSRLTYGEIERRANQLARRLLALGVGAETPVGVCLERGSELVPALLGILKAGGAYVPLDPAYPQARLDLLVEDARVPVLVTQSSLASRFPAVATHVLMDEEQEASAEASRGAVDPDQLAYFIYTSGSTGRPKGVAITHRSAVALVRWTLDRFSQEELAGVLASTSISFDLSIFELFVPLSRGGAVLLAPDALALPELPAASEVTLINTVPSAIAELVRLGPPPTGLRTVNLAGEPLQRALVQQVERWHPGVRVLNLYGPSEDTTYSTWAEVSGEEGTVTIGRPAAGTSAYLLDRHGNPVPRGVPGELHLAGAGLARGYFGRPELTAAEFIPDPFASQPGGRLYATGDLARLRQDGNLEFLGRRDHQVKIRGFRVELGEIETALSGHPAVREAAVLAREGSLAAYVSLDGPADTAELRAFLQRKLPAHMVPGAFVVLDAFPLTPNGKV